MSNLYNTALQGRFAFGLKRLLQIVNGPGFEMVAPELVPVIETQNVAPEIRWLQQERLACGQGQAAAGGAGLNSYVVLWNPIGSKLVAVVEEVAIGPTATGFYSLMQLANTATTIPAGAAASTNARSRDFRYEGTPMCQIFSGTDQATDLAGALTMFSLAQSANTYQPIKFPLVLGAGNYLIVRNVTANSALQVSFAWRERIHADTETTISGQ